MPGRERGMNPVRLEGRHVACFGRQLPGGSISARQPRDCVDRDKLEPVETQDWAVVVALASVVATAVIALFTHRRQAASHREQLAAQERQLRAQLDAREREVDRAAEREHFARLWEKRQNGYLELAEWALRVRLSVRHAETSNDSAPLESLALETLAQVIVYADYDVYARGDFLRGSYEQLVENLERLQGSIPAEVRTELLRRMYDEAWSLIHAVREHALRLPDWREPIPLHPQVVANDEEQAT